MSENVICQLQKNSNKKQSKNKEPMQEPLESPRSPRRSPRTMNSPRTSPRMKPLPHMTIDTIKEQEAQNQEIQESTDVSSMNCNVTDTSSEITITSPTNSVSPNSAVTITPLPDHFKLKSQFWEVEDDFSEITSRVFLGTYRGALNKTELHALGITHVVQAVEVEENPHPHSFTYYNVPVRDVIDQDLTKYLDSCADYIHDVLLRNNHNKVFVHCGSGISRSAALVIAYLMKYDVRFNLSYSNTLEYCRDRRMQVKPNKGFKKQLRTLESRLKLGNELKSDFYSLM